MVAPKAEHVGAVTANAQEETARGAIANGPKANGRGQWAVSAPVSAEANPVNGANPQLRCPKSISHWSLMNEASNRWLAKSK